jgi:Protein of unknown function (DUF2490)
MKGRIATLAALSFGTLAGAQRTVHSAMIWGGVFGDHRFGAKSSLYWDYQPRRADAGDTWQINLGAVGYTRDLNKSWRTTAALGWSRGYRYGAFPSRSSSFEVRPFVQLNGTRSVGSWTWTDRMRAEFRIVRPIGEFAPAIADWAPTVVRLRRQDKFQHRLTADARWYAAASDEFLVNVLPAASRVAMLEQIRAALVLGRQLTKHNRAEIGYGLQRNNRRGGYEMNHTLLLYFRTAVPLR